MRPYIKKTYDISDLFPIIKKKLQKNGWFKPAQKSQIHTFRADNSKKARTEAILSSRLPWFVLCAMMWLLAGLFFMQKI